MVIINSMVDEQIINSLQKLKQNIVLSPVSSTLPNTLATHPDMLIHHAGDRLICAPEIFDSLFYSTKENNRTENNKIRFGFGASPFFIPMLLFSGNKKKIYRGYKNPGEKYPKDIKYNCFLINNTLICNLDNTDKAIIEYHQSFDRQIINCKQGYASCSTLRLSSNAVITSDTSIAAACEKAYANVLLIRPGYIELEGYSYGFIGGCGGMLDRYNLGVFGSISSHPDGEAIKRFATNQGVNIIELKDGTLMDYGGIIQF